MQKGWFFTFVGIQIATIAAMRCATTAPVPQQPQSLRVREIVVVDDKGVERVRIGANLPDAMIKGKRVSRGDVASGVMLYDRTGQERGGYITFEHGNQVALTLDNTDVQSVLLVAPAEGGAVLHLGHGKDELTMRADEDGPRVTAVENGVVSYQQPAITAPEKTSICTELRGYRGKASDADLMEACRRGMPESACRACLDHK